MFLLVFLCAFLTQCVPTYTVRGNFVDSISLDKIQVGHTSKADVRRYLGPPSFIGKNPKRDVWYYISEKTKKQSFFELEVLDRHVYAVAFDNDKVSAIQKLDGERNSIIINKEETPSRGKDPGFFEDIIGNIGRYEDKA